jgi:cation diffusion facilitator family transporter
MASVESRRAVLAALGANVSITVGKLAAGVLTGSGAMFAEAVHSAADSVNQVFLLVGLRLSETRADDEHPHGYGKEAFFWSFLAAIFIFVAGATFSLFEGIRTLIDNEFHSRSTGELAVAFTVLGLAFLFEGASLIVVIRGIRARSKSRGWSFAQFLRRSPDMTIKTVFWEDSAATAGLVVVAVGLALTEVAENEMWDGVASVIVGVILTAVALMLGAQSRRMLIGAAATEDVRETLREKVMAFDEVELIVRLLTMQLGARSVLVSGELQLSTDLTTEQIEDLLMRIDRDVHAALPQVSDTFWELRHHPMDTEVGRRIFE